MRQRRLRNHLKKLFSRALDIITYRVQRECGRSIKEWEPDEKVESVREMHRIRSSNRLLSESNQHFREKMTLLMHSFNDSSRIDEVSENDISSLYKKLEAFVRGYNTINRSRRAEGLSMTESKGKEK